MNEGLSLFVPVYNEEELLPRTLPRLLEVAERLARPIQLVVVDNGSTDATPNLIQSVARTDDRITALRLPTTGVGAALRAALPHFRHPLVVAIDADLTIDLSFLDEAVGRLDRGADMVVGSKKAGTEFRPFVRVLASEIFIWILNRGLALPCDDVSIGAKAYRADVLQRYRHLIGRGSNYVLDILVAAHEDGLRIVEIPVSCHDTRPSRFNLFSEGVYRFSHLFHLVGRRALHRARAAAARSYLNLRKPGYHWRRVPHRRA